MTTMLLHMPVDVVLVDASAIVDTTDLGWVREMLLWPGTPPMLLAAVGSRTGRAWAKALKDTGDLVVVDHAISQADLGAVVVATAAAPHANERLTVARTANTGTSRARHAPRWRSTGRHPLAGGRERPQRRGLAPMPSR